ncbi:MAG TPA: sigma 54-interacting transcriptional regulator, partial [Gemmataceae bacterium]
MAGHVTEADADFRWQSFFQDAAEPLFLLSRRRRILFVNRAWETLTGWSGAQVRGMLCSRGGTDRADPLENLARALCPPPGVLHGKTALTRRPAPARSTSPPFWDLAFSPLQGPDGILGILGRVQAVTQEAHPTGSQAAQLVALRERVVHRHRLDLLPQTTPAERRLAEQARLASRCDAGVLLVGETGSGKHWLARTIHFEGSLRNRTFVALDCLRLPAAALADFAFGENGLLRRAMVGTLYLRNLPALPRDLQERFAVFFRESAGNGPRVIGSCRTDPALEVRAGRLLEELYS